MTKEIWMQSQLWRSFREQQADPKATDARLIDAFGIGTTPESMDEGARLILAGLKTATSALPQEFDAACAARPFPGALSLVKDGSGAFVAVVETRRVELRPFDSVDENFAKAYGEWDGTLATWRRECGTYYAALAERFGFCFGDDTPLLFEWFEVVWPDTRQKG